MEPPPRSAGSPPRDPHEPAPDGTETPTDEARLKTPDEAVAAVRKTFGSRPSDEIRRSLKAGSRYIDRSSHVSIKGGQIFLTGDVVAGGQQKTQGPAAAHAARAALAHPLPAEQREKVLAVFTPASFVDKARAVLLEHHLVILYGPAGSGKATAGLHILASCELSDIDLLDPEASPDRLLAVEFKSGRGYLVDRLSAGTASHLSGFLISALQTKLAEAAAYAVLTIDDRVQLRLDDRAQLLVPCELDWDLGQVLDRHIDWYLRGSGTGRRQQVRETESVERILEERPAPAVLDRMAMLLAQAATGAITEQEALERFEMHARHDVEAWFAEGHDLDEYALMISVAVLGGASYGDVAEAASRLRDGLTTLDRQHRPFVMGDGGQRASHLFTGRRARLVAIAARLIGAYETSKLGSSPTHVVEFKNPAWYSAALNHVWDEHDLVRETLLEWLRETCCVGSVDVRERAAYAIGKLAEHDFANLWPKVLTSWAGSGDDRIRAAAAVAMSIPAWRDDLAPQVLRSLLEWSADDRDWRRRWTAAAAFGSPWIGPRFPELAMHGLEMVAQVVDARLSPVVARSIAAIFALGEDSLEYALWVLSVLERWSGPKEKRSPVRQSALSAFVKVANDVDSQVSTAYGNRWPEVLYLLNQNAEGVDDAFILWLRSLQEQTTRDLALEALRSWVDRAEHDPELYGALQALIVRLAVQGGDRGRRRLIFHLTRWANNRKKPSASAKRLCDALSVDE